MSTTPSSEGSANAPLRWGVIGAASFVANAAVIPAILSDPASQLAAYASLSGGPNLPADKAGAKRFPDYESLIDSGEVDAVYIALPNSLHLPWVKMAAEAGTAILCEKPLALDPAQVAEIAELAEMKRLPVGEAYMTQFHLRDRQFRAFIKDGGIGDVLGVEAAFTFELASSTNYRWSGAMGGGALLDVGIYLLDPILELLGTEPEVTKVVRRMRGDVDVETEAELHFPGGQRAHLTASFVRPERQLLRVRGTEGSVELANPFTPSVDDTEIHLLRRGEPETLSAPASDPYVMMIAEFASSVTTGTSFPRPLGRSLAVARLLHSIMEAA